jgi:hypothetical protein
MEEIKQAGQSTLEFLLVFIFALGFLFTFAQLSLNAGLGYLLHYTVYMSSRSYLVYDDNNNNPGATDFNAEDYVLRRVLGETSGLGISVFGLPLSKIREDVVFNRPEDSGKNWIYTGVALRTKKRMSPLPIVGGGLETDFVSESFLGREPTRGTCWRRICTYVMSEHLEFTCDPFSVNKHVTIFDNGC